MTTDPEVLVKSVPDAAVPLTVYLMVNPPPDVLSRFKLMVTSGMFPPSVMVDTALEIEAVAAKGASGVSSVQALINATLNGAISAAKGV